jgi:hypothetical protein
MIEREPPPSRPSVGPRVGVFPNNGMWSMVAPQSGAELAMRSVYRERRAAKGRRAAGTTVLSAQCHPAGTLTR